LQGGFVTLLIGGLCLWAGIHLLPSAAAEFRWGIIDKLGFNAYRGIFSLAILSALALIIFGWRSSEAEAIYLPPDALRPLGFLLMALAFLCLGATQRASRIGRTVRHPQLTGVLLWSLSHLTTNGDCRSLVLFGGLALWTIVEMVLISKREGAWNKPEAPSWGKECLGIAISLVVMAAFMFAHPWLAGVPLL
jgi:uncharacterized membrane protein